MPADLLIVFGRAPRPGHVKTRLAQTIGPERAAALYRAFLEDSLAKASSVEGLEAELWLASEEDLEHVSTELPTRVQIHADLGRRMTHALADGLERAERVLLIGSDAPTLPPNHLGAARDALTGSQDLVLGPSADGGYFLVGVRGRTFDFGDTIRWSTRHALADTLEQAARTGRRATRIGPWYDVDDAAGLRLLRTQLALRPRMAPRTARALAQGARSTSSTNGAAL